MVQAIETVSEVRVFGLTEPARAYPDPVTRP